MNNSKFVFTLLTAHFKLSKKQEPKEDIDFDYMRKIPSSSVVGSIMYAMVSSRLDTAYGVGLVSRFMENSGKEH